MGSKIEQPTYGRPRLLSPEYERELARQDRIASTHGAQGRHYAMVAARALFDLDQSGWVPRDAAFETPAGWVVVLVSPAVVLAVDALDKHLRARARGEVAHGPAPHPAAVRDHRRQGGGKPPQGRVRRGCRPVIDLRTSRRGRGS